jgi:hypothetical protein
MVSRFFACVAMMLVAMASWSSHAAPAADAPTVLVIGDSQAQGVAGALERLYLRSRDFRIDDKSKIGTGLNSKSTYDWPAAAEQLSNSEHAGIVIVMFGANDRPPVRIKGVVDPGLSEKFGAAYGTRVTNIVKSLKKAKMEVIWLGHPVVKDADYTADMDMLNQIMQTASVAEGAQFLSLWDITGGDPGSYNAYGKALDGQTKRLRADDGIHLTPAGYDLIAARLDPIFKSLSAAKADAPVATATQAAPSPPSTDGGTVVPAAAISR